MESHASLFDDQEESQALSSQNNDRQEDVRKRIFMSEIPVLPQQ